MIDFGSNQVIIKIINHLESNNTFSELLIKVNHGVNLGKEYKFNSNDNKTIRFGRKTGTNINIVFSDDSTSRIQSTITYENNNWYIMDSDGIKTSSNGTWMLADEYYEIQDGMIFRAGSNIIDCKLIQVKENRK